MADVRWRRIRNKTLAWWLFKGHHTHFNHIYWTHRAASALAFASTRGFTKEDPTVSVFAYAKGNRRIPRTLGQWAAHYDAFDRWTRNASILAIAGYLETYIAQVVTSAIESCPALIIGGKKEIDGVSQLKFQSKYDLYTYAEPFVKGDWQARMSTYRRLFGECPFDAHLSDLEKLRKLRNNSGHAFGRDIGIMKFAERTTVTKLPSIDDATLQTYLALAENVAKKIENHAGKEYVGAYEIFKILHFWITAPKIAKLHTRDKARRFSKHLGTLTAHTDVGVERATELVEYYQRA